MPQLWRPLLLITELFYWPEQSNLKYLWPLSCTGKLMQVLKEGSLHLYWTPRSKRCPVNTTYFSKFMAMAKSTGFCGPAVGAMQMELFLPHLSSWEENIVHVKGSRELNPSPNLSMMVLLQLNQSSLKKTTLFSYQNTEKIRILLLR